MLRFAGLYSSLSQADARGNDRAPVSGLWPESQNYSTSATVYGRFNYPESRGMAGSINVSGSPYVAVQGNQLTVQPTTMVNYGTTVSVDFGDDIVTTYHVTSYSDNQCTVVVLKETIVGGQGITVGSLMGENVTVMDVEFEFENTAGGPVPDFFHKVRFEANSQARIYNYFENDIRRDIKADALRVGVVISDNGQGALGKAFVMTGVQRQLKHNSKGTELTENLGAIVPLISETWLNKLNTYALVADRLTHERGASALEPLVAQNVTDDIEPPEVTITSPKADNLVVAGQRVVIKTHVEDISDGLHSLALLYNGVKVAEQGGVFGKRDYQMQFDLPKDLRPGGEVEFTVVGTDRSGNVTSDRVAMPVDGNVAPTLEIVEFEADRIIRAAERLALAEFWVRSGGNFKLSTQIDDDAGIDSFGIYRLTRDGQRIEEYYKGMANQCPLLPITSEVLKANIQFNETEATEYEMVLADNTGNISKRTFIINPLSNVTPAVRITVPSEGQYIVAGTFRIYAAVVASDDRELDTDKIRFYVDGIQVSGRPVNETDIGGKEIVDQAYREIYDEFERKYGVHVADDFGSRNSPYAVEKVWSIAIPSTIIGANETIKLSAKVTDEDNAVGSDEISFIGAEDEINPEVAVLEPAAGFGAIESTFLTLGFRGYDNVKVSRMEVYRAIGVRLNESTYKMSDYGSPLRSITNIEDKDFEPVTTVNIDTPIFTELVSIPKIVDLPGFFPAENLTGTESFDVWFRMVAVDASGNERISEVSYPIRVDERPVLDVINPVDGKMVVESTQLPVTVNAFDDVGVQYVRMKATRQGDGLEITNRLLRQPPYSYIIELPAYDPDNPANNIVNIEVEAVDTFGDTHDELDKHRAVENLSVQIVEDEPPVVAIAIPLDGSEHLEGSKVLVQVNAVDDVGIGRVVLTASGLIDGDQSFTDNRAPYEFLLDLPFGQANRDVTLTASVTEHRLSGTPRTVETLRPVTISVAKDLAAPEISILQPAQTNTTIVEKRVLPYVLDVTDNVSVTSVNALLYADRDQDGVFGENEVVSQEVLLTPPYSGTINVSTISEYLGLGEGEDDGSVNQLAMRFVVRATDGVGNDSEVFVPATLRRNAPPEVTRMQLLDKRGFSLGEVNEITEAREFIVNVLASDAEVGVDSVTLYQALNPENDSDYRKVLEDVQVPFHFNMNSNAGQVGDVISYRAIARDIDGYESALSMALDLTIVADQPPEARIVKPANDESVIIDGQLLEIYVEALDDLGHEGIDKVVFYVNDNPVQTVHQSLSEIEGTAAQEHIYRALVVPPQGVDGFVLQAVAYDVVGHTAQTGVVRVGRIDDTVQPKLSVLQPFNEEIVTMGETLRAVVSVEDIGSEADRRVTQQWFREYRDVTGVWQTLAQRDLELFRDDAREVGDATPVSDPDNHYYIYWADFSDGHILFRGDNASERVRVVTTVSSPNHTVSDETIHEVGFPVSERRYLAANELTGNGNFDSNVKAVARSVYYSAIDQYKSETREGAMVAAWSSLNPANHELGFTSQSTYSMLGDRRPAWSGLFLADAVDESEASENGERFVFSPLLNGASEIFSGTITELHADETIILASKTGEIACTVECDQLNEFGAQLHTEIRKFKDTGEIYYDNNAGELLLFNTRNGDEQFGLPYLMVGRIDMPYKDVYGLDRKDNLALVANGYGGVQAIDISNISAPYHVGYIKPNGFTRDVKIAGNFAYIAASHEGLVIADLTEPSMPIVAKLDTQGVANRVQVVGKQVYVTNMAGDGVVAQLNVIGIHDPYQPRLLKSIDLPPARDDYVTDGVYDVAVVGNKAMVSSYYSDQEDRPVKGLIEIIDLGQLEVANADATIPVVTHEDASYADQGARGLIMARGAIQAAGGRQGIQSIELPALTVVQHSPNADQFDVSTKLDKISIELSAVLPPATTLTDWIVVQEADPTIGLDITERFDVQFRDRNGEPAYRFIELVLKPESSLTAATDYYVTVKQGLNPLTGASLPADYTFRFTTSVAGDQAPPQFASIFPDTGDINGGTDIVVRGYNFGAEPKLELGGQPLQVKSVVGASEDDPFEKIYATTVPNYAGPAAVKVTAPTGAYDMALGVFTYVDELRLSFVTPAIVNVSQAGANDKVDIVGYGFHDQIRLTAYMADNPASAISDVVDQDRLKLYSSERMEWVVPDFGDSFRGFVDLEITDDRGRKAYLPRALFYGRLSVDRTLQTAAVLSKGEIASLINSNQEVGYIPDPGKLPPGAIVDLASDTDLNLIYVLGKGVLGDKVSPPSAVVDNDYISRYYAPGWISLIHYDRSDIGNAAPMHGLGYFNLPQDLVPQKMLLGKDKLYVTAYGYHFPNLSTEHEDQSMLLVYDRENRLPGQSDGSKDRDILYKMPLPFTLPATQMSLEGELLVLTNPTEGTVVLNMADPLKPSVIRIINTGTHKGTEKSLKVLQTEVNNGLLHLVAEYEPPAPGADPNDIPKARFVFDLSLPSIPQVSVTEVYRHTRALDNQSVFVETQDEASLLMRDFDKPQFPRMSGEYEENGFRLGGLVQTLDTTTSIATVKLLEDPPAKDKCYFYLPFYDVTRPELMSLIDVLVLDCAQPQLQAGNVPDGPAPISITGANGHNLLKMTDDGLALVSSHHKDGVSRLKLVDYLTLDLVASTPADQQVGVSQDSDIVLEFNRGINVPDGQTEQAHAVQILVAHSRRWQCRRHNCAVQRRH